jgi:site-specific DNA-methyltransferase (adenine-specific)
MEKFIINHTKENELVFDPFSGSGSVAIGCIKHGRRFCGYEIRQDIYNIAIKRIKTEQDKTSLFNKEIK